MMKLLRVAPMIMVTLALATGAFAQHNRHGGIHQEKHVTKEDSKKMEDMAPMCKAMMSEHREMNQKMQKMDARLDKKMAALEKSKGDKRTDLMVSVIRELIVQRKEMHAQMAGGTHSMMGHMMNHMASGTMMKCDMMKMKMGGDAATSKDGGHSAHGH